MVTCNSLQWIVTQGSLCALWSSASWTGEGDEVLRQEGAEMRVIFFIKK